MGEVRFAVDDMVNLRFAVSPLWETVAALGAVTDPGRHAVHLPWIKQALAAGGPPPAPGFGIGLHPDTVPPPRCPLAEIEEELATVATEFPTNTASGRAAAGPDVEPVLRWWRAAVRPHWPRIRAVLEADIAHRTRQLAEDGIGEVLTRLHPALAWTGDRLVSRDLPAGEHALAGSGVTLVPSAFADRCRLVAGRGPVPPCVIYPARGIGTLWERASTGDGLPRLLGRSRAGLLAEVAAPATTTQLAARTGLSPGAVSQHLTVLRDAGLVTGHRYGREVHYVAGPLGHALLGGAGPQPAG